MISLADLEARGVPEPMSGCLLWLGALSSGYGTVRVDDHMVKVHRLAHELRHGPIAAGRVVMHRCDNRACFADWHLRTGSVAENNADRAAKGRSRGTFTSEGHPARAHRGEKHWCAKLSAADVEEIRARVGGGETQPSVARRFSVHPSTISRIARGEWRKEVPCSQQNV